MAKPRLRSWLLVLATLVVTAAASGIAELAYRALRQQPQNLMYFRDGSRAVVPDRPTAAEDLAFRMQIQVPWPDPTLPPGLPTTPKVGESSPWFGSGYAMPRHNLLGNVTWKPGSTFYLCYRGPKQDYFDADGCVAMRFNRFGLRERDDLTLEKPAGVRRVVCLGDSFTLGWGVRAEHNWPVLVEGLLRGRDPAVQVLNCGGAGSAYADEYALALEHRHGRFAPDLVVVTLCLNDLLLTNGKLCHYRPEALPDVDLPAEARRWWMASALLRDLGRALGASTALALDPSRDWNRELQQLPADHLWYRNKGETPAVYWVGGTPQRALRSMRDWCAAHGARFAVVVWPLLQGLGPGRFYPFGGMHEELAVFCRQENLALLDLLPVLRGEPEERLWVSPDDMHPNEHAQQVVAPALAEFLGGLLASR